MAALAVLAGLAAPATAAAPPDRPTKRDYERQRRAQPPARKTKPAPAPRAKKKERARRNDPFAAGRTRVAFGLGFAGGLYGERVFVMTAGVGQFVADGLEVGLDGALWVGGDETVGQLSPQLRYVVPTGVALRPYIGGFYRRWFVGGPLADVDALGVRGGLFYAAGGNAFIGAGVAYEWIVSACDDRCSDWYPELAVSLTF